MRWSKEEDELLSLNYQKKKHELKSLFPNRTNGAIASRAFTLGLKKDDKLKHNNQTTRNVKPLLEESAISYYWIGFLLADGHFNKNNGLHLSISQIDLSHLQKFAHYISCSYIKYNNIRNMVSVWVNDKTNITKIREKFKIASDKTHNPPDINFITDKNLFISLLIGFIDGDGCIRTQTGRKDVSIQFHLDKSWLSFLTHVRQKLIDYFNCDSGIPKIGKDGYSVSNISNSYLIKKIKLIGLEQNLPFLDRKWSKIDMTFISIHELAAIRRERAKSMLDQGFSSKEIRIALGMKCVSKLLKQIRG